MNYDHLFERAVKMMEGARPASGFRPETTEEWLCLARAVEELMYASLVCTGKSETDARTLAHLTIWSPFGRALIDIGFSEAAHVPTEK